MLRTVACVSALISASHCADSHHGETTKPGRPSMPMIFLNSSYEAVRLVSDPFNKGWDLFGTADFRPTENVFSPNMIWYVQVGVLVVGHVLGLVLAHDRAISLFSSARTAIRTQYAMLALMVMYTCTGLWLLSSG